MLKFFKKTARKIFGHHKHHDAHAAPLGPVASTPIIVVDAHSSDESAIVNPLEAVKPAELSQPVVAATVPAATPQPEVISEPQPLVVEKVSRSHNKGLGRRTKNTMREARTVEPVSEVKIEEKANDIALQLESLHEAKAQVPVQDKESQNAEIIRKAQALQLKTNRLPQIYESAGKDAYGLNGAPVKSPFVDSQGKKKPAGERTMIMDSLQKGESTYRLKMK